MPAAETALALPAPAAHPSGSRNGHRKTGRVKASPAKEAPAVGDGGTRDLILAELRKKPMTSGQLIDKLPGVSNAAIYSMLNILRSNGVIKSVPNPDGVGKLNQIA